MNSFHMSTLNLLNIIIIIIIIIIIVIKREKSTMIAANLSVFMKVEPTKNRKKYDYIVAYLYFFLIYKTKNSIIKYVATIII